MRAVKRATLTILLGSVMSILFMTSAGFAFSVPDDPYGNPGGPITPPPPAPHVPLPYDCKDPQDIMEDMEDLKKMIAALENQIKQLGKEMAQLGVINENLADKIKIVMDEISRYKQLRLVAINNVEAAKYDALIEQAENEIEQLQQQIAANNNAIAAKQAAIAQLMNQLAAAMKRLAELEQQLLDHKHECQFIHDGLFDVITF